MQSTVISIIPDLVSLSVTSFLEIKNQKKTFKRGSFIIFSKSTPVKMNIPTGKYLLVLMHEIAHDQIPEHRKRVRNSPYRELQFFGGKDTSEREANAVAAHVLIDDNLMIDLIQEGRTLQHIACAMEVPEDLVLIEIEDYTKMHPDFIVNLPRGSRGNYLKDYDDGTFDCCDCTAEE